MKIMKFIFHFSFEDLTIYSVALNFHPNNKSILYESLKHITPSSIIYDSVNDNFS